METNLESIYGYVGWLTLRDKRENRHEEIKDLYLGLCSRECLFYTTDYVLDETFTLLFRRLPFKEAKDSLDVIELAIKEGERHKNEVSGQANK